MIYGNKFLNHAIIPMDYGNVIESELDELDKLYNIISEYDIINESSISLIKIGKAIFNKIKEFFYKIFQIIMNIINFIDTKVNSAINKLLTVIKSRSKNKVHESDTTVTISIIQTKMETYKNINHFQTYIELMGGSIVTNFVKIDKILSSRGGFLASSEYDAIFTPIFNEWDEHLSMCQESINFISNAEYNNIFDITTEECDESNIDELNRIVSSNKKKFGEMKIRLKDLNKYLLSVKNRYIVPMERDYNRIIEQTKSENDIEKFKNDYSIDDDQVNAIVRTLTSINKYIDQYFSVCSKGISGIIGIYSKAIKENNKSFKTIAGLLGVYISK